VNDLGIDPASTALLLMDLQNGIIGSLLGLDAFVERLAGARDAARTAGVTIGYVRVALTPEEAAAVPPASRFAEAAASGRMDADAPATQIDERLTPADGEIVVRKSRVGAFSTTDLAAQLDARRIDTLVLTGVATSGVVLSTLRDAADRDYRILVLEDGCADRDPEVHRVLLEKVFPRQATVTTVDAFVAAVTAS
jgi:nicotinamidase-related amidase